eukprot:g14350.t1
MPQDAPLPLSDDFGCVGDKCWAGVYVDSASKEILHLEGGGRAFFSPDGTITNMVDGGRIARWSFPRAKPVVDDIEWATGDELLLVLETNYRDPLRGVAAKDVEAGREFELSSSDGGRTWMPVTRHDHPEVEAEIGVLREAHARLSTVEDCVILALELPAAVSLFPLTSAMWPIARYLTEGEAQDELLEDDITIDSGGPRLQPLFEVFEVQPFRPGEYDEGPEDFKGVIVISRDIPRPSKKPADLSCVMNGIQSRATWLSWSMVLCSTTLVKHEEVRLYVTFEGRRISLDISFRHALPPRHVRLAWPDVETFDILPQVAEGHQRTGPPSLWSNGTSGMARERASGTAMAVCTMFKNEAPYLEEWLQYHRLLGVSKVYLYDNGSSDRSREVVRSFEMSRFVEVRNWPHDGAQTEALNDCLCRFRHTTRWMSFIDVDEFVDPAPNLAVTTMGNFGRGRVSQLYNLRTEFDDEAMAVRRR